MASKGSVSVLNMDDYAEVVVSLRVLNTNVNAIADSIKAQKRALSDVYNGDGLDDVTVALDTLVESVRSHQTEINKCAMAVDQALSKAQNVFKDSMAKDALKSSADKIRKE